MDPDEVAEKVSALVSRECTDASVEDYKEALRASIGINRSLSLHGSEFSTES